MSTVKVSGWSVGMQKVECTKSIREFTHLGLAEAKAVTDGILDRIPQAIEVATPELAEALAAKLREIGVVVDGIDHA